MIVFSPFTDLILCRTPREFLALIHGILPVKLNYLKLMAAIKLLA